MARKGQSTKSGGMMMAIFIVILIAYIAYIMLLHPWERKQLLTTKSNMTINLYDCDSGLPITDAQVLIYSEEGVILHETTSEGGVVQYQDFPDCYRIKATLGQSKYENVCVGNGEDRVINLCFDHPEANPYVIHFEPEIGIIGGTSGEIISEKPFNEIIILSYPLENTTVNYPSYFLYSNILWSEGMGIKLTNINETYTRDVIFEFTMNSKRGDPDVIVYANNRVLFKDKVGVNESVSVTIPKQDLNETLDIQVKCDFDGWMFWTTQDCNLTNIRAIQEFYVPDRVNQELSFSTTTLERGANQVELSFLSSEETIGGVKASINDYKIFDSTELIEANYSATINAILLNLTSDFNTLRFEANQGAQAYLRAVNLNFTAPVTSNKTSELIFYLTDEEFDEMNRAIFNFYVSNVYLNGIIRFKVNEIYHSIKTIEKAGWNTFTIEKEDLDTENTVEISALEGRFELEKLKISYE